MRNLHAVSRRAAAHCAGLLLLGTLTLFSYGLALAQSDPALNCAPGQAPQFDPMFLPFAQRIGPSVGAPTDCIAQSDDGTANQPTTTGLLARNADGSLLFINELNQDLYSLDADGFSYLPGESGDAANAVIPSSAAQPPLTGNPTSPAVHPAAAPASGVTPGKYGCYAQWGGGTAAQVGRALNITKELYADGTWRDTSYGSMTASNPQYAGPWTWDGSTLTLTWGTGSVDTFRVEARSDGTPALVQTGSGPLMTCYLIAGF